MIISNSRKFIFIHIHKAGGSSMEQALSEYLNWNDLILGTTELGVALNRQFEMAYGLFDHSSVRDISAVCGPEIFESHFSFALVRHPVDRIVSMYNFIHSLFEYSHRRTGMSHFELRQRVLERRDDLDREFMSWPVSGIFAKSSDFSEFIRSPLTRTDSSFGSQSDLLQTPDGRISVDLSVKLEDLSAKLPMLWDRLGIKFTVPHTNKSPFVKQRVADVSPNDRKFIQDAYYDDFVAFEYD